MSSSVSADQGERFVILGGGRNTRHCFVPRGYADNQKAQHQQRAEQRQYDHNGRPLPVRIEGDRHIFRLLTKPTRCIGWVPRHAGRGLWAEK